MTQISPPAAGLTDRGVQRETNEDVWSGPPSSLTPELAAAKGYLYVVADGVGGRQGGEVASRIAVQVTQQVYYADPNPDIGASLGAAIQEANRRIYHQGISSPGEFGMSTTITAAVVHGNQLVVANVGDSRAYLMKGGQAHQLTVDHTWVAERVAAGILTPEEAANHPQRNVITRSLGGQLEVQVDVFGPHPLVPGDHVLLCTDGLSDLVSAPEMTNVVVQSRNPNAAVRRMVDLAKKRGAPDNVTAVVVSTERGKAGPGPVPSNLVALAGTLGAVVLVVAALALLMRPRLPALFSPLATVTPMSSPSPSPTLTLTPAVTPSPPPAPELTAPEDGAVYYNYNSQEVTLEWTWSSTLEANQHFVVVVEDGNGTQVLTKTVGPGEEMAHTFPTVDVGVGEYHWTVWVERDVEGKWEVVAQAEEWRTLRVLPPATATPIPTPTLTPTPEPSPTAAPLPSPLPPSPTEIPTPPR